VIISYICPDNSYLFFREVIPLLEREGIRVHLNQILPDTELILPAILPCTPNWVSHVLEARRPYVLWHWDLYSFVDFSQPRWSHFLEMLEGALDIWSCTYETARQLKEVLGRDSYVMPAWVNGEELNKINVVTGDYAMYAASSGALGKRTDWAEAACRLLKVPLLLTTGQNLSRSDYLRKLGLCRFYLMTAFEESNASIPALEAAYLGKHVVLADLPASREIFGPTATYFSNWDFQSLKDAITKVNVSISRGEESAARVRVRRGYNLPHLAGRMAERLYQITRTR
jgi:hypothetical protein